MSISKDSPLNIAFIWHMHQPCYKDPETEEYVLPWVYLHGIKDYYDVVAILDDYPNLHQTFNLTPSLLEQIKDYAEGRAKDKFLELTLKKVEELSLEERFFILKGYFHANWDNMIKPFPRYMELLKKRGTDIDDRGLRDASRYFSHQDLLDLQVLFNLSWLDPVFLKRDNFLKKLKEKGRDYTQEEKLELVSKSNIILKLIIPKYSELEANNTIELSTSPYYHPILPLLCDTYTAREPTPDIVLPRKRFIHPEDAMEQIKRGVSYFEEIFGHKPKGMWPSEGAVSEAIIPFMKGEGISWFATDEGILAMSLNHPIKRDGDGLCTEPELLYKAYHVGEGKDRLALLFRDHLLSDLIGFVYCKWDASEAASNFIDKLHKIRELLIKRGCKVEEFAVTITLDGENPWEYYVNDGRDFLTELYTRFSEDPYLKLVTVSEFLEKNEVRDSLDRLSAGSWIDKNFNIWIGHQEDNTAWDLLSQTRSDLVEYEKSRVTGQKSKKKLALKEAWKNIYIAEGSDWYWWYGDDHLTPNSKEFDELFRKNLKKVYRQIGKEPPSVLESPIITEKEERFPSVCPTSLINPTIDGEVTSYFEWLAAGRIDREQEGSSMHRTEGLIKSIYYGFDLENFFYRIDFNKEHFFFDLGLSFAINIVEPENIKFCFIKDPVTGAIRTELTVSIALKDVIEVKIPFAAIKAKRGETVKYFNTLEKDGKIVERWPSRGYITFEVPTEEFDLLNWYV